MPNLNRVVKTAGAAINPSLYTGCVSRVSLPQFSDVSFDEQDMLSACFGAVDDSRAFDIEHCVYAEGLTEADMYMDEAFIAETFDDNAMLIDASDEQEDYFLECNRAL